jgi:uncharacterized RDD family membrane protein YckC
VIFFKIFGYKKDMKIKFSLLLSFVDVFWILDLRSLDPGCVKIRIRNTGFNYLIEYMMNIFFIIRCQWRGRDLRGHACLLRTRVIRCGPHCAVDYYGNQGNVVGFSLLF